MKPARRGVFHPLLSICLAVLFLFPSAAYQNVSDNTLKSLPRPGKDFDIHDGAILSPILIPRVAGTPGSTTVLNHFVDFFRTSLPTWNVEFQNSTSVTPVSDGKEIPFVNFIASRDPPWALKGDVGRLTLVAHYDSKYEPEGFIGAIDSAAPCAMIMHAMRSIDDALTKKWESMKAKGDAHSSLDDHIGIQVIFLDGEEAFKAWTATDSLYGSRALAQHWDSEVNPAMSVYKTPLSSISLFVLLDLLGAKQPEIGSYYPTTHWAYQKLANVERRLRDLNMFKSGGRDWFPDASKNEHEIARYNPVEDDHLPFLQRGVEVMHIVDFAPIRGFPDVWHTMDDDGEHLDIDTVEDWSLLFAGFAAEWMELEGFMPDSKAERSVHPAEDKPAPQKRRSDKTEL